MVLVDSHCHLELHDFPDTDAVIARAKQAGVVHAVIIGQYQSPGDFGDSLSLARAHPDFLSPTLGLHPHDAAKASEDDFQKLIQLCGDPAVVAVGETGLDFYRNNSPPEAQRSCFRRQCALARELKKPLVVHVRDAHEDCYTILKEEKLTRGAIHCFTGNKEDARRYLDLGFVISISGIVTYAKTDALREAVQFTPVDRLMVETDSPYLSPVPFRGRKNEPAHVAEVARAVAQIKQLTAEELSRITAQTASDLFGFRMPVV